MIQFNKMFKYFNVFEKFPKSNSTWTQFDLKLTLRYPEGPWNTSEDLSLTLYRRDDKLIWFVWYVKLSGKHCQICDGKPPYFICVWRCITNIDIPEII